MESDETRNHYGGIDWDSELAESLAKAQVKNPTHSLDFYKREDVRNLADRVWNELKGEDGRESSGG